MAVYEGVGFGLMSMSRDKEAAIKSPQLRAAFHELKAARMEMVLAQGRLDAALAAYSAAVAGADE